MTKVFEPHEYYKNLSLENIEDEEWIDIDGYKGSYQISSMGRLKSLERMTIIWDGKRVVSEKIMRQHKNSGGYLGTMVCLNSIKRRLSIHRLVAIHFIENPQNKPQVNHKKGIKTDNRKTELEWATILENHKHASENNLKVHGERQHLSKLNSEQIPIIRTLLSNGMYLKDVALKFGVSISTVYEIKIRKIWKHIE